MKMTWKYAVKRSLPLRALEVLEKTQPELAILDLTLKESSGLELLLKDIRVRYPDILVLVVSMA